MEIKDLLLRLGTENLIKFIDGDLFKILHVRNKSIIKQKNFTETILKLNSEKKILSNTEHRNILLNSLKENEAIIIGKLFNLKGHDIWKKLIEIDFKKKKNLDLLFNVFNIKNNENSEVKDNSDKENPIIIEPNYPLFDHQIEVLQNVKKFFNTSIKKTLLHMPTGAGKTRTAINLVSEELKNKPKNLIIWLAHTEELCQQAHDEFSKAWEIIGNRKIKSYKLFKNFRYDLNDINSGFVVLSLDYAYSLTKTKQSLFFSLARKCNFVVMDEAHMSVAPSYQQVLEILVNKETCLLGLTATPGRAEIISNENIKLAKFYNKQKVTLNIKGYKTPIDFLQDKNYLATVEREQLEVSTNIRKIFSKKEISKELKRIQSGMDFSNEFVKKLSTNETRTNMIIEKAIIESKEINNKIIIFAGSIDTAKNIDLVLKMENINCSLVTGETNLYERRNSIEKFKDTKSGMNIIINYGVLTTGFDAPKANVAIIGRPTQSVTLYSQMVGRVMRGKKAGGKKTCKVVTVKDPIKGFRDMSESFTYWEELWQ
ncbi:DEAD/DEAH box helicase [Candidatus Pelagibacter sp. HIMB1495]|uniref:DEAD/DEAH box helicase n=1 Tax=unclassified Candidatus Pelagibacter TaxID=2647897 RepID=UPI003F861A26